jgi:hypothetical protein
MLTRDLTDFTTISTTGLDDALSLIRDKVLAGQRITDEDALVLFEKAPLPLSKPACGYGA